MASTKTTRTSAIDICAANTITAKAWSESDRAAMRARFPFAAGIVAELTAAGFKPRVIVMAEGTSAWRRDKAAAPNWGGKAAA